MKKLLPLYFLIAFAGLFPTRAPADLERWLVAWYRLDGNLTDASGNGNNGSVGAGSAAYAAGVYGQAWDSAAGRYISIGNPANLQINTETGEGLTISAWVKPDDLTFGGIAGAGQLSTLSTGYGIYWRPDGNFGAQARVLTASRAVIGSVVTGNQWHFVVGVFSPGSTQLWVNGILHGTETMVLGDTTPNRPWVIGASQSNTVSNYFTGSMDNAMIYNRALTPAQIRTLHALGTTFGHP